MSAVVEQLVLVDEWRGLYGESWKGVIVDEAFAHPAKFSRALIRKIYDHVIAEGWATKGDSVVDPFGGVALGGFDAMRHGLNWTGCELEQKFVELGGKNIALWNERYSRMPNWGKARLVQGDSRRLSQVVRVVDFRLSSPPFVTARQSTTHSAPSPTQTGDVVNRSHTANGVFADESPGQLGAMKEGDHSIAISSPPYIDSVNSHDHGIDWSKVGPATGNRKRGKGSKHEETLRAQMAYTENPDPANLGAMPMGDLCVTSPPYNPPMSQDHNGTRGGQRGTTPSEKGAFVKYGNSDGQLEGMSMDGFNAAITSPPFESSTQVNNTPGDMTEGRPRWEGGTDSAARAKQDYADYGPNNIGNERGETFWSASRLILEQLHQVLNPNAHAVFVVKAFVRDKKIVDFPAQWAQLCEAVGFKLLHHHRASLVEHAGTQGGFDEDKEIRVERKSFFRRLAESKGSPRIDHESVLCFRKVPA